MTSARLRILATTDLHAHALGWDYYRDEARPDLGLASLVPLIRQARAGCPDTLLLDNGDFLQGSPLGDWAARHGRGPHPMIAAMNALGYDAATLGNHEFSHGLPLLQTALRDAAFPVVSSNLAVRGLHGLHQDTILKRTLTMADGSRHDLRIGIAGTAPPQTATWEARNLQDRLTVLEPLEAAADAVRRLRDGGADIVILLAHTGIGDGTGCENIGIPLSERAGADVLILGHTHLTYPDGPPTLATPAVMAGCHGSHLGCIDLGLRHGPDGWAVTEATSRLLRPDGPPPPDVLPRATVKAHDATRVWLRQPVGPCDRPLHAHFARIAPCDLLHLIAAAQVHHVTRALTDARIDGRPVLAAVAPFRTGSGRGGGCSDIPPGLLTLRHVNDLYPHPNTVVALSLTGQDVADWLERAAIQFTTLAPGTADAPILHADCPAFDFDMIAGLSFGIDPGVPPRFDPRGGLVDSAAHRITDIRHEGRPLRPDDRVILVTNSYRASGSGGFPACRPDRVILDDGTASRDALAAFLASGKPWQPKASWHFAPLGRPALFDAPEGAERYLSDIAHLRPEPVPAGAGAADGPRRFRLWL